MSDSLLVTCPACERENVPVSDGIVAKHKYGTSDVEEGRGYWCQRGGFPYRSSEGWIVLVGHGCTPARISMEESDVAWFADEVGAQRWIEEHPKAKGPFAVELKNYEP